MVDVGRQGATNRSRGDNEDNGGHLTGEERAMNDGRRRQQNKPIAIGMKKIRGRDQTVGGK